MPKYDDQCFVLTTYVAIISVRMPKHVNVAAAYAGNVGYFRNGNSRRTKLGQQGVVFSAAESRVRIFRGRKSG